MVLRVWDRECGDFLSGTFDFGFCWIFDSSGGGGEEEGLLSVVRKMLSKVFQQSDVGIHSHRFEVDVSSTN